MEKSYKRFSFIILQQDSIKARLIMGLYETFRIAIALDVFALKLCTFFIISCRGNYVMTASF